MTEHLYSSKLGFDPSQKYWLDEQDADLAEIRWHILRTRRKSPRLVHMAYHGKNPFTKKLNPVGVQYLHRTVASRIWPHADSLLIGFLDGNPFNCCRANLTCKPRTSRPTLDVGRPAWLETPQETVRGG